MRKITKGDIVEINIPNEGSIKAIVLDIIQKYAADGYAEYTYIMYAHNKVFKANGWCRWGIEEEYSEEGEVIGGCEYEDWSSPHYEDTLINMTR